jgi:hypothetical protein
MYFHTGDEKMRMLALQAKMAQPVEITPTGWPLSAIGDVHRDFKAKAHIGSSWFFPFHTVTPEC